MPRGRRKKPDNYLEEIATLDEQIADLTQKLQSVKDKKRARMKEEEKSRDENKWEELRKSGVSVDAILDMVKKHQG